MMIDLFIATSSLSSFPPPYFKAQKDRDIELAAAGDFPEIPRT
jgi:hypothetical protein